MQFQTRGSHSPLHRFIRPVRGRARATGGYFLRAESFFNTASYIEETGVGGYGDRRLHEQSHGESFFTLFEERFRGNGLYILDEPEAALSPNRQLSFLVRMHDLIAAGSQFIIATHSPIILGYPDARIYGVSANGLEEIAYEDTEHFQVTRAFLTRREAMLRTLLEDD
jgi:predicted ATPase